MPTFHPDLAIGRFIPQFSFGPRIVQLMSRATIKVPAAPDDIEIRDVAVPASGEHPAVSVRLYQPRALQTPAPALYWIHGGGFIQGAPEQDERTSIAFARALGITAASIRYRLSPEHHAPAALDDAYAGLVWLAANAVELGVDPARIAVGGASAGGGLAASLVLFAHDKGEVDVAFQLLVYPMLDDRTVTRTDLDTRNVRVWTPKSNRYGWTSYLGHEPGVATTSPYAAAARREDLRGLPPTWIGVGTLDLFYDEDVAYANRLTGADVDCELFVVPGAFHGFDALFGKKPVVQNFWEHQADALRGALFRD